jgi:hypothetical protein
MDRWVKLGAVSCVVGWLAACGGGAPEALPAAQELADAQNKADLDDAAMTLERDVEVPADGVLIKPAAAAQAAKPMPRLGRTPTAGPQAAREGWWSSPFETGLVGIHLNVLPDGELMYYGASVSGNRFDTKSLHVATLKPGDTAVEYPGAVTVASFCTGNLNLPDGRVLLTGGTARFPSDKVKPDDPNFGGASLLATYRPGESTLRPLGRGLAEPRWYPTNVMLPGHRVAVLGGLDDAGKPVGPPEVVDVTTGTSSRLTGVDLRILGFSYPRAVAVGADRVVVLRRNDGAPYLLNTSGTGSLTALPHMADLPTGPMAAIGDGRYLVSGSRGNRAGVVTTRLATFSAQGVEIRPASDMAQPRTYHELTTLPDGSVLATGGTDGQAKPREHLAAERWTERGGWAPMASAQLARGYHATAALLPDGTVIKMGSTRPLQTQAEVFYPPYLFTAAGQPRPRPAIENLSRTGTGGRADIELVMDSDAPVSAVNLVRTGATTHQSAMGQAFVRAAFTKNGRRLSVQVPASPIAAPEGVYWVFVMDAQGTPSIARSVRIH